MRDYVLQHEDLEAEDLDVTLLDAWALEGYVRIHRLVATYPFYEGETSITTTSGVSAYATTMKRLDVVYGDDGVLNKIGHAEAQKKWLLNGVATGKPVAWSTRGTQTIYLWPQPDAAYSFTLEGKRVPTTWPTSSPSDEPDLPEDFHQIIRSWMLHRALLQQDDGERAAAELSHFQSLMGELVTDEIRADIAQPLIIGGQRRPAPWPAGMRLDYDTIPS